MTPKAIIQALARQRRRDHVARAWRHGLDIGVDGTPAVGVAIWIAENAHAGQVRKYTGEPYVAHSLAVARTVARYLPCAMAVTTAVLHDVVEDTDVSLGALRGCMCIGPYVACLVDDLTDVSKPSDGNRAARKAIDRAHTARAHPLAKLVKLADLLDNTREIVRFDPDFAQVYMAEKRLLLEEALQPAERPESALERAHAALYAQACFQVNDYRVQTEAEVA